MEIKYNFNMFSKEGAFIGHQIAKDARTAARRILAFHLSIADIDAQEHQISITELDENTFEVYFSSWQFYLNKVVR